VTERLTDEELDALAGAFHTHVSAAQLLDRAGLERHRHPRWGAGGAAEFWREVASQLRAGVLADGRRRILATAAVLYPGNPVFASGGAAAGDPPSSPGSTRSASPAREHPDGRVASRGGLPVHATVLALDAVGYRRRGALVQRAWREGLREVVGEALRHAAIPEGAVRLQDRGDGFLGTVDAEVPKAAVVADFARELRTALRAYNLTRNEDGRIRLRLALHQGEVLADGTGFAGGAAVVAARLVDAPPVRRILGSPAADLALIVSAALFDATVSERLRGLDPTEFRRVDIDVPEFAGTAWVNIPRASGRPGTRPPAGALELPPRNRNFTGRLDLLARMRSRLAGGGPSPAVALHGMGGVGKTQLAAEYARRHQDDYRNAWWIPAEDATLINQNLAELAERLGVGGGMDVPYAARAALAALGERDDWLLVFDNVEQPQLLASFLPSGNGHVIVTSRNPNWGGFADGVEVDVFDRAESVALLRRRVPAVDEPAADELADELGDLPLALEQAASYIEQTRIPARDYLGLFRTRREDMLSWEDVAASGRRLDAVWSLSTEKVERRDRAALALLRLCAHLAPEPIPVDVFTGCPERLPPPLDAAAADEVRLNDAITRLLGFSLLRRSPEGLILHRLVQAGTRSALPRSERRGWVEAALHPVAAAVPGDVWNNPASWVTWRPLLPHVQAVVDHADAEGVETEEVRWLLDRCATYLETRGEAGTARPLLKRAHALAERVLGEDDPSTLVSASNRARNLAALGSLEKARDILEDTLERSRRVLAFEHPITLTVASNLASVLRSLGDVETAFRINNDVFAYRRRVLGSDHPDTLAAAPCQARDLAAVGSREEARRLHEDTLARRRQVLGEDHPDTLASLSGLAAVLRSTGETAVARSLDEKALGQYRRVLGDDHPHTMACMSSLARDAAALGDVRAARELDEESFTRRRRILGEDHPHTLLAASLLVESLRAAGEGEKALELDRKTRARRREVLGTDDLKTLVARCEHLIDPRALEDAEAARSLDRRRV
jgi:tetratricopeptide (TPR) repeat protein